ncbi:MAG: hypothetical protein IPJ13_12925 [Saprospiraceae bacterium]|nr:hypothetical protein [Saprospiraceae bacterium]
MNEIANICELGAESDAMVRKGMGSDKDRKRFLFPGVGIYGGSCFPKRCTGIGKICRRQ